jgi:hypothetical protein
MIPSSGLAAPSGNASPLSGFEGETGGTGVEVETRTGGIGRGVGDGEIGGTGVGEELGRGVDSVEVSRSRPVSQMERRLATGDNDSGIFRSNSPPNSETFRSRFPRRVTSVSLWFAFFAIICSRLCSQTDTRDVTGDNESKFFRSRHQFLFEMWQN